jgi:hypothetical protein
LIEPVDNRCIFSGHMLFENPGTGGGRHIVDID